MYGLQRLLKQYRVHVGGPLENLLSNWYCTVTFHSPPIAAPCLGTYCSCGASIWSIGALNWQRIAHVARVHLKTPLVSCTLCTYALDCASDADMRKHLQKEHKRELGKVQCTLLPLRSLRNDAPNVAMPGHWEYDFVKSVTLTFRCLRPSWLCLGVPTINKSETHCKASVKPLPRCLLTCNDSELTHFFDISRSLTRWS